jgi:hypothetical protein
MYFLFVLGGLVVVGGLVGLVKARRNATADSSPFNRPNWSGQ